METKQEYRMLEVGEIIEDRDEILSRDGKWIPVRKVSVGYEIISSRKYRRPISSTPAQEGRHAPMEVKPFPDDNDIDGVAVIFEDDEEMARVYGNIGESPRKRADRIVHRVNTYPALVDALNRALGAAKRGVEITKRASDEFVEFAVIETICEKALAASQEGTGE